MAIPNPFVVPNSQQSPYLAYLASLGGSYDALRGQGAGLPSAGNNLVAAGQQQTGPGEFDPGVALQLATAANPVNTPVEDYFFNKYMADVNGRLGARGLVGQGAGEGLANDAAKSYLFGRADTAQGRAIAGLNAANAVRTGQVGRAASLTGAGLSPYDTLNKLLAGETGTYTNAGELGNMVSIANARNQTALTPTYLNMYGVLAKGLLGAAGGAYSAFNAPQSDAAIAAIRDSGLTSDTSAFDSGGGGGGSDWLGGGGGGDLDVTGWFDAKGGRVPGRGAYDHVRAVLMPHEFVIRRPVAERARPALESLNAGNLRVASRKLARIASVAR